MKQVTPKTQNRCIFNIKQVGPPLGVYLVIYFIETILVIVQNKLFHQDNRPMQYTCDSSIHACLDDFFANENLWYFSYSCSNTDLGCSVFLDKKWKIVYTPSSQAKGTESTTFPA